MALLLGSTALSSVMLGAEPVQRVMLGTTEVYSAGVTVIATSGENVNISTLFDPTDWANADLAKILVVPDGVVFGSNDNTLAALRTGTGRGGALNIVFEGDALGAGGTVSNSGAGGPAFLAEEDGVILTGDGNIWAGGGLGGLGGTGGQGSYSSVTTLGPHFSKNASPLYYWVYNYEAWEMHWNSTPITASGSGAVPASYVSGIYTYIRGSTGGPGLANYYYVSRQNSTTLYQAGGAPGTRGRGQGYDGAATAGTAGATGINNAGNGGASGDGGDWGASGAAGSPGANGNYTNGTVGAAGGNPGLAIINPAFVDVSGFTGSALGL